MVGLLLVHGWGFGPEIWDPLLAQLPGVSAERVDRGYFGRPRSPRPAGPVLAVGHSLGALRLLVQPPANCVGLVAINGFDRFVELADAPGVPRRLVERMLDKMATAPGEVVGDFRRRCSVDTPVGITSPKRLAADLVILREADARGRSRRWALPLLSLQGAQDPVLPPALRDGAFQGAPRLERAINPDGGHLLPLTHPSWCAERIAALMERLQ